jgi:hypothetical protein
VCFGKLSTNRIKTLPVPFMKLEGIGNESRLEAAPTDMMQYS